MLGLRPPRREFRILCLEGSDIDPTSADYLLYYHDYRITAALELSHTSIHFFYFAENNVMSRTCLVGNAYIFYIEICNLSPNFSTFSSSSVLYINHLFSVGLGILKTSVVGSDT